MNSRNLGRILAAQKTPGGAYAAASVLVPSCESGAAWRVGRGEEGFPWILSAHKQKSKVSFLALTVVLPSLSPDEDQGLLLAAAYVSDAQYNRNVPFETSPRAIR